MTNPDQETINRAVEDARRILGHYLDSVPRDANAAVDRLISILNRQDLIHALDRVNRRRVIRLVE
jgi:hypothetical protein